MQRRLRLLLFIFILPANLWSQILPAEGDSLNYRIIGFSVQPQPKAKGYVLEIARGHYNTEDSFRSNIVSTLKSESNRVIAEVRDFGEEYTWRMMYGGKRSAAASPLHHFSTMKIPNVDTTCYRLRILKPAEKFKDAYVFLDDNKVMYDMSGNAVWFLPRIGGYMITPRDIKLTPQGSVTFLFNPAYEVDYNGHILWKGPMNGIVNGEHNENCHHEFTRLHSGHYMVLGTKYIYWKQKSGILYDTTSNPGTDTLYKKTPFGTIIEYDEKGNVVWSWKSSDYFLGSDLVYFNAPDARSPIDVHENAFYFDEKNQNIYISFKNISRVLKIKYPEGRVVNCYGERFLPGIPEKGNGLFCGQHACNLSRDGYLYLFNNNICENGGLPKLIMMKEPLSKTDSLKKVWEYNCNIDEIAIKDRKNYRFISGGSVQELSDRSIFACMNGTFSKIFIVSKDKEVLWSAVAERWDTHNKRWEMTGQYRSYMIEDRNKLENLIWNQVQGKE